MQKIEDILKKALLSGEGVFLPGVGALVVDRHPAVMEDTGILAPRFNIALWPGGKEGAYSIIDYMLKTPGTERDTASETYETWLRDATDANGTVVIEDIGEIKNGGFTISPALEAILNPNVNKRYSLRRKRSYAPYWIFAVILLATTLISLCVWLFCDMTGKGSAGQMPVIENSALPSAVAGDAAASSPDIVAADSSDASALSAATATESESTTAVTGGTNRYYVVLGVFADPANADRIIRQTLIVNGNLTIEKISYKGKTMVTIYSSADRADATANMRRLRSVNPDVWVYHLE